MLDLVLITKLHRLPKTLRSFQQIAQKIDKGEISTVKG